MLKCFNISYIIFIWLHYTKIYILLLSKVTALQWNAQPKPGQAGLPPVVLRQEAELIWKRQSLNGCTAVMD